MDQAKIRELQNQGAIQTQKDIIDGLQLALMNNNAEGNVLKATIQELQEQIGVLQKQIIEKETNGSVVADAK